MAVGANSDAFCDALWRLMMCQTRDATTQDLEDLDPDPPYGFTCFVFSQLYRLRVRFMIMRKQCVAVAGPARDLLLITVVSRLEPRDKLRFNITSLLLTFNARAEARACTSATQPQPTLP